MTLTNCSSCGEKLTRLDPEKMTDCFCAKCKEIVVSELAEEHDYRKVSIYLLEESIDYKGKLYSRDECNFCDKCGEETPDEYMDNDICDDCKKGV